MRYRASEVLAEGGRAVRTLHVLYGRGSVTRARPGWCGGERCTCYILTVIATPPSPCCHTVGVWGGLRRGGARTTVDTAGARPVGHCDGRATPRMRMQAVRGAATASQNGRRRKRRRPRRPRLFDGLARIGFVLSRSRGLFSFPVSDHFHRRSVTGKTGCEPNTCVLPGFFVCFPRRP